MLHKWHVSQVKKDVVITAKENMFINLNDQSFQSLDMWRWDATSLKNAIFSYRPLKIFLGLSHLSDKCLSSRKIFHRLLKKCWYYVTTTFKHFGAQICVTKMWQTSKISSLVVGSWEICFKDKCLMHVACQWQVSQLQKDVSLTTKQNVCI